MLKLCLSSFSQSSNSNIYFKIKIIKTFNKLVGYKKGASIWQELSPLSVNKMILLKRQGGKCDFSLLLGLYSQYYLHIQVHIDNIHSFSNTCNHFWPNLFLTFADVYQPLLMFTTLYLTWVTGLSFYLPLLGKLKICVLGVLCLKHTPPRLPHQAPARHSHCGLTITFQKHVIPLKTVPIHHRTYSPFSPLSDLLKSSDNFHVIFSLYYTYFMSAITKCDFRESQGSIGGTSPPSESFMLTGK